MKTLKVKWYLCAAVLFSALVGVTVFGFKLTSKNIPKETPPANSVIVSKTGEGQYETISEALEKARPNMRILVRPGVYKEKLKVNKPIELIADSGGADGQVIIESAGSSCAVITAGNVVMRGFTLRTLPVAESKILKFFQARKTGNEPCIEITEGGVVVEDCDITSEAVAAIGIRGHHANPIIRRCKIHDGNSNGIWVIDHARAVLEDCEMWGTNWAAVRIENGANAQLRRCKVFDVKNSGILLTDYASGSVEHCEVYNNDLAGIEVRDGSSVVVTKSSIHGSKEAGVVFKRRSTGRVEECEIYDNRTLGVGVVEESSPTILRCNIYRNSSSNIGIMKGSDPLIKDCKIYGGAGSGIYAYENSRGTIENCEIFDHETYHQIVIQTGSDPTIRKSKIYDGKAGGVLVLRDGAGTLEECNIYNNQSAGVWIRENASPTIRHCKINGNSLQAIVVHEESRATVEDSDLTANRGAPGTFNRDVKCGGCGTKSSEASI